MTERAEKIHELDRLLHAEHIGVFHDLCTSNTCDIKVAARIGATLWAAYQYDSSGAASKAFSQLLGEVNPTRQELNDECDLLLAEAHEACVNCNAIIWDEVVENTECGSCGKRQPYEGLWGPYKDDVKAHR